MAQLSDTKHLVRRFRPGDEPQLLQCMKELAVFEGYDKQFRVSESDLTRYGLGNNPAFQAFVAVSPEGNIAAMAVTYTIEWTYDLKPTIVMKELYVKPQSRSRHLGKRLLEAVYAYADEIGAPRVQWTVLKSNTKAKKFYRSNGANKDGTWELWRKD